MNVAFQPISVGFIIAILVIVLAILGLVGVLPDTPTVVFAMLGGLALARLL